MVNELFNIFCATPKGAIARIKTLTKVAIPKKWGISGEVTKLTDKMVKVGCSYENSVNRHRIAEGKESDFKAFGLPYGIWLKADYVLEHKGLLQYRIYDYPKNVISKSYFVDGQPASENEIATIEAYYASRKHSTRQGVDKEVNCTNIKEENIVFYSCNGVYEKEKETQVQVSATSK